MGKCNYGCGQDAIKQLKNGNWCCSEHHSSCPALRKKISEGNIGKSTGYASTPEKEQERRHKISEKMKINGGGYRKGSGRGKSGWYKGIWCDSSWELAWVVYNLEHNVGFSRNIERFPYVWDGEIHYYIPYFLLKDGTYIEIKGYLTDKNKVKISSFKHPLKVLLKKDIKPYLQYAIGKYGKDFIRLYSKDDDYVRQLIKRYGGANEHFAKRLIREKLLKEECYSCGVRQWHGLKLDFVLDYIDKKNDNRLENLILLCPNCYSLKNKIYKTQRKKRERKKYFCSNCGKEITSNSKNKMCINCAQRNRFGNLKRPSKEQLLKEVERCGYEATGRKYNITGNAVKKWLIAYGVELKKRKYNRINK